MHGGVSIQFLCRESKSVRYISKKNRIFSFPAVLSGFSERCPHRAYLQKKCECNTFLVLFSKKLSIAYPSRLLSVLFSLPKIRKSVAIIEEKQKIAHHSTPLFTKNGMGVEPKNPISEKNSLFSPSLHESNRYPTSCISNQFWRLVRLFRFFYENLCVLI